jgi:hypothetical protein
VCSVNFEIYHVKLKAQNKQFINQIKSIESNLGWISFSNLHAMLEIWLCAYNFFHKFTLIRHHAYVPCAQGITFSPNSGALYTLCHAPNFYEIHPWSCDIYSVVLNDNFCKKAIEIFQDRVNYKVTFLMVGKSKNMFYSIIQNQSIV